MKQIRGNIIRMAKQGEIDCFAHGCNCFNNMGAGFALSVKQNFLEAWEADRRTICADKHKLGDFTEATHSLQLPNGNLHTITIFNCYTQFMYGRDKNIVYADYKAIDRVFWQLAQRVPKEARFAIPWIGAGYANGDWRKILRMIERPMREHNLIVVEFDHNVLNTGVIYEG